MTSRPISKLLFPRMIYSKINVFFNPHLFVLLVIVDLGVPARPGKRSQQQRKRTSECIFGLLQ